jgi:hypothetical protein
MLIILFLMMERKKKRIFISQMHINELQHNNTQMLFHTIKASINKFSAHNQKEI